MKRIAINSLASLIPAAAMKSVPLADVLAGDVMADTTSAFHRCGLVRKKVKAPDGSTLLQIEHCSSNHERGVVKDFYPSYFKGPNWKFYRP